MDKAVVTVHDTLYSPVVLVIPIIGPVPQTDSAVHRRCIIVDYGIELNLKLANGIVVVARVLGQESGEARRRPAPRVAQRRRSARPSGGRCRLTLNGSEKSSDVARMTMGPPPISLWRFSTRPIWGSYSQATNAKRDIIREQLYALSSASPATYNARNPGPSDAYIGSGLLANFRIRSL
jgi:hypothetical protein